MSLIKYFNQPYKGQSSKKWKWSLIVYTGLFIFIFLFVFKPSSYIYEQEPLFQLLISLGFGIVVSIVLYIFKFFIEPKVISDKWTLGKSILWSLFISMCIGIASYFYIVLLFEYNFSFQYLPIYIKYFFYSIFTAILIGSVPISIYHLSSYLTKYKKALKEAGLLHDQEAIWEEDVVIKAGKETNNFNFNPRKIVYIVSDDNYITVFSFDGESLKKVIIRGTLREVEKDLKGNNQFFRCHKSYIINILHFNKVVGHSQNMKLKSEKLNLEIPVSRSKTKLISEKLTN